MVHADASTDTYRDQAGLDELRAEALPFIVAGVVASAWLASVAALPGAPDGAVVLPILLALGGFAAYRALARSVRLAAGSFVAGLVLTTVAALWIYPNTLLACLLAPEVLVTGLLLGSRAGLAVALGDSLVVAFAQAGQAAVVAPSAATMALALIWATALLGWLASRSVYLALDWAWHSYVQALGQLRELRARQGDLNRALKSLNDAYYRLEQVNAELERARAAAQEARRHKAEFAATITHELRTPLNLIIGFSEMMATAPHSYAGGDLPPDYQCDVDAIYRNARHLSNLIDDILDLSQIEAGRMALAREPSDLGEIVGGAVSAVRGLFEGRGLELEVTLPRDVPRLLVDPTRIRQVLINLLNNAARFTERGGVAIRARVDAGHVVVAVTDTGPGIAAEDLPTVFEEFRQVDGSIRRRYGGSGLGLAICKNFVELHGGSIWAASAPGVGSTFSFSLPLTANVVTVPARNEWETWVRPGVGQGDARRVLAVVDDDLIVGKALRRYVDGWHVALTRDSAGLSQLLRPGASESLGAVVRVVSGDAVDRRSPLPALPPSLPVITCSLAPQPAAPSDVSAFAYLEKPVRSDQIAAVLQRLRPVRDVVIVDDDPEMVRLLARMVRAAARRARVRGAYRGEDALAALLVRRPDALFLDLLMPGVDGEAVLARVRADERLRDLPVVVVSARGGRSAAPMATGLSVSRADGLSLTELTRCVQGCLNALELADRSNGPGLRAARAG